MPRNVRPSWISLDVDGNVFPLEGGPRARSGRIRGTLYLRSAGEVVDGLCIETFGGRNDALGATVRYGAEIELRGDVRTLILPDGTETILPLGARVRVYGAPEPA